MMAKPWIEKYRPREIDDIIGNVNINFQIKKIIETGDLPHLLLTGPAGVGKTSSVLCLSKKLLAEHFSEHYLELNASDERGIDTIRNKIFSFCKKKAINRVGYKIIFLDEVDSMTSIAQQALRRIIEIYSANTRFILSCNISSCIIEAIQSRCTIFKFKKILDIDMYDYIKNICNKENIKYNDDAIKIIAQYSDGDMRKCLNNLQVFKTIGSDINENNIRDILNIPDFSYIINLFNCRSLKEKLDIFKELLANGYSPNDILKAIFNYLFDNENYPDDFKTKIFKEIADREMNIINGGDSYLQLYAFLVSF